MAYVTIIAMLALIEYLFFSTQVGRARGKFGIEAPATTGHPTFERLYRVQINTLEQLIVFLPALFAFGYFFSEIGAVAFGIVFMVGRALYYRAYVADPATRGIGVGLSYFACLFLVLGSIVGALLTIV